MALDGVDIILQSRLNGAITMIQGWLTDIADPNYNPSIMLEKLRAGASSLTVFADYYAAAKNFESVDAQRAVTPLP